MMRMKDLKWMLNGIPDEAVVTIDGNYNVDIVSISAETMFDGILCDLKLSQGFSITKDSILDSFMAELKRAYEAH